MSTVTAVQLFQGGMARTIRQVHVLERSGPSRLAALGEDADFQKLVNETVPDLRATIEAKHLAGPQGQPLEDMTFGVEQLNDVGKATYGSLASAQIEARRGHEALGRAASGMFDTAQELHMAEAHLTASMQHVQVAGVRAPELNTLVSTYMPLERQFAA